MSKKKKIILTIVLLPLSFYALVLGYSFLWAYSLTPAQKCVASHKIQVDKVMPWEDAFYKRDVALEVSCLVLNPPKEE